jgi:hypothetical protein
LDFTDLVIVGAAAGVAYALLCYIFLRPLSYSLLDPLIIVAVSIPLSAALLAVLCVIEVVDWSKLVLFSVILLAYLCGARMVAAMFSAETFHRRITAALASIRAGEITTVLLLTVAITAVLGGMGLSAGAGGDARFAFARSYRPLIVLQSGLFLFSLVLLLSPRLTRSQVLLWLLALVALSIPFSGKSIVVPVLYWYGLRRFLSRRTVSLRVIAATTVLVFGGASLMGLLAYGTHSIRDLIILLGLRVWNAGDVYILAYQMGGLERVHGTYPVHFIPYVLHPLTSLVGVRAYDRPLGAMLTTAVSGTSSFGGPNPQLPVLLDYFFPGDMGVSVIIAFLLGAMILAIRPLGLILATSRSRFLSIGVIAAAIFCPGTGFLDMSLGLIALIGIVAATVGAVGAEILFASLPALGAASAAPSRSPGLAIPPGVPSP